jgi:drug/metabolite transporter (DMT)-like permease
MSAVRHALPGLTIGAVLIGFAPIFVRLSEVGPSAAAFWRVLLALPLLALMRRLEPQAVAAAPQRSPYWLWVAGLAFAADLATWHHSIGLTSVANSTLLCNLSPVFITLVLHFGFGEKHAPRFWLGLLLALAGAAALVAGSLRLSAQTALGDLLAVITALFYAIYQFAVSRQRRVFSAVQVMLWSSAAAACALLPLGLLGGENFWPADGRGWLALVGLALIAHVGGQGLIAWALAHLPASFSSVTLLVQPVAATLFAWWLLGERFGLQQALGGSIVLSGILLCRLSMPRSPLPDRGAQRP